MGRPIKDGRARDERITIRISKVDRKQLARLAGRMGNGTSVNDLVLEGIRLRLQKARRRVEA